MINDILFFFVACVVLNSDWWCLLFDCWSWAEAVEEGRVLGRCWVRVTCGCGKGKGATVKDGVSLLAAPCRDLKVRVQQNLFRVCLMPHTCTTSRSLPPHVAISRLKSANKLNPLSYDAYIILGYCLTVTVPTASC